MEFAICQWNPDFSDSAVEALQAEGVTAIEPGPSFLMEQDDVSVGTAAEKLRSIGIRIYSCHAPFAGANDLSLSADDDRASAIEHHIRAMERAVIAGASCMVIHPGGPVRHEEEQQRCEQLCRSLEALLKKAEDLNIRLALENMPPGLVGDTSTLIRNLLDDFDSPFLGACFDTGHAHMNKEGVLDAFENMRERIINFHIQDNDGQADKHLQPPYGTIDWKTLIPGIRAMAFQAPLAIEAPVWAGASFRTQLRELKALFAGELLTIETDGRRGRIVCEDCHRYCFGKSDRWSCGCNEDSPGEKKH